MTSALPDTLRTQAYIGGAFVDAADGATFDSVAPGTGQVIAKIAACGDADVDRAVAAARTAFDAGAWSRIDPADRKSVLLAFADLIEAKPTSWRPSRRSTPASRSPTAAPSTYPTR